MCVYVLCAFELVCLRLRVFHIYIIILDTIIIIVIIHTASKIDIICTYLYITKQRINLHVFVIGVRYRDYNNKVSHGFCAGFG